MLEDSGRGVLSDGGAVAEDFLKEHAASAIDPRYDILSGSNRQRVSEENDSQQKILTFWSKQMEEVRNLNNNDFKTQDLPLARIKKIMKMDEDVKMISAEAPLLFSKAAQFFISELSLRAWVHTEESKRRTLQRNDISSAITKFDQFDFLIDIVPREELKTSVPKRAYVIHRSNFSKYILWLKDFLCCADLLPVSISYNSDLL